MDNHNKMCDSRYESYEMLDFCVEHIHGYKCTEGDGCFKKHHLPREEGVLCRNIENNRCTYGKKCMFLHPGEKQDPFTVDPDAYARVQSVAETLKYFRSKEVTQNDLKALDKLNIK